MSTIAKITYNFNENDATSVRDYSENHSDGTGANLTVAVSTRVGNEGVFDGSTSSITTSTIPYLSNVSGFVIYMGLNLDVSTADDFVFNIPGIVKCTWNGTTLTATLTTTTTDYTTSNDITALSTGTYYDITLRFNSATNGWRMFVGDVAQSVAVTTGNTPTLSPNLEIGWDGSTDYGKFSLNEFKLYDESLTTPILTAIINSQNGITSDYNIPSGFSEGDIIGAEINDTPMYAIVSYVNSSGTDFRIYPLTTFIRNGSSFYRVGHLWDTTRQWMFKIDDTPEICFYDNINETADVLNAANKIYCLGKDGIIKSSSTKTANYTTLSNDQIIYVDSSSSAFTITLEASPTTNKEIEIIDGVGSCNINTVTIDGNGNNIIGSGTYLINSEYDGIRLIFNGVNWNLH